MSRGPKFDDGFSEMIPVAASAGIGHNLGPEWLPIGKELEALLKKAHRKAMTRAVELIDATPISAVDNAAQLKKATERVRQIQGSLTELDGQRKAEKEPYRLGGAQVDGFFNEKAEELALIKMGAERLMNSYNTRVTQAARLLAAAELRKRLAAAELTRKLAADKLAAAEAAKLKARGAKTIAKAADKIVEAEIAHEAHQEAKADVTRAERQLATPAADLTRVRSANAVQSQREFVDFRGLDRRKIDLEKLRSFLTTAAIEAAVRQYATNHSEAVKVDIRAKRQPIEGVEFFINSRTGVGGGGG